MSRFVIIHRETPHAAPVVRWYDCGELALAAWIAAAQRVLLGRWACAVSASSDGGINHWQGLPYHAAQELVRAALAEQLELSTTP